MTRHRLRLPATLAVLSTALLGLTLDWPDWIEQVLGVDPDVGDGSGEILIVVTLVVAAAVSWLWAHRVARQVRAGAPG